jgi:hypothetical protein
VIRDFAFSRNNETFAHLARTLPRNIAAAEQAAATIRRDACTIGKTIA